MVANGRCGSDGKDWGDDGTAVNVVTKHAWSSYRLAILEGSVGMVMSIVLVGYVIV